MDNLKANPFALDILQDGGATTVVALEVTVFEVELNSCSRLSGGILFDLEQSKRLGHISRNLELALEGSDITTAVGVVIAQSDLSPGIFAVSCG